jgi:hypothetical protein
MARKLRALEERRRHVQRFSSRTSYHRALTFHRLRLLTCGARARDSIDDLDVSGMIMGHRTTVIAIMLALIYQVACASLSGNREPLSASLHTDSTEIGVHFRGNAYVARIGFVFTNNTGGPISRAGCGGPGWPDVEKKVNERWVPAYYPVYLACRIIPDFSLESGATHRDTIGFMAFEPGHRMGPEILVDSIDGVYRLHWNFSTGREAGAKGSREVKAISNEFRMILRPVAPPPSTPG